MLKGRVDLSRLLTNRAHPEDGEWMAWIDGELAGSRAKWMEEHLQNCSHCATFVNALRAAADHARIQSLQLPPEYMERSRAEMLENWNRQASVSPDKTKIRACLGDNLAEGVMENPERTSHAIELLVGMGNAKGPMWMLPAAIWATSLFYTTLTVVAWTLWMRSGEWGYMGAVFGPPYDAFTVFLVAAAAALSFLAMRQSPRGEALHSVWTLLFTSALCRVFGTVLDKTVPYIDPGLATALRPATQLIAGPVAEVALGFGLLYARRAYLAAGLKARLTRFDWLLLGAGAAFTIRHVLDIAGLVATGAPLSPFTKLNWLSEPSLLFVLVVAVSLRRIAISQGGGLIAYSWSATTVGAMVCFLGNLMLFFEAYDYLKWPYHSVGWLVWLPMYAAFALGPAYQVAANQLLMRSKELAGSSH